MYGVRLHPAKDREGTKLSLSVAHTGVLVFQVQHTLPVLNTANSVKWYSTLSLPLLLKSFLQKMLRIFEFAVKEGDFTVIIYLHHQTVD